jgi:hypothetical protein
MPNNAATVVEIYRSCMDALNDAEYCANVVDAVLQSARKVYTYGSSKPRLQLVLSSDIDYAANILVDKTKKSVIVMLRAPNHLVYLLYEAGQDGKFVLRRADVSNMEMLALTNPPLRPSNPLSELGL